MRILLAILVIIFVLWQYQLWFPRGGIIDFFRMQQQIAQQKQKNEVLEQQNSSLLENVQALKNNAAAIENQARKELGMIKKGETFYQIVEAGREKK